MKTRSLSRLGARSVLAFAVASQLIPVGSLGAQAAVAIAAPVVTRHEGTFNGKKVVYTASVGETVVRNASGTPAARIVSTAYTADGANAATRPVLFVCNGGPISPSYPLHMLALGPRRLAIPADLKADAAAFKVVDNTYTVLDVADLVFFDPASTGWSRVLDGTRPEEYYTVDADAQQFAAFIDQWLRDNNRIASPKYLLGESYATIRVPEAGKQLLRMSEPIVLDGMFLMGQAANQLEVNTRPYNIVAPVIGLAVDLGDGVVPQQGRSKGPHGGAGDQGGDGLRRQRVSASAVQGEHRARRRDAQSHREPARVVHGDTGVVLPRQQPAHHTAGVSE
jgi:carboxypeptidase C (cathepsin A)